MLVVAVMAIIFAAIPWVVIWVRDAREKAADAILTDDPWRAVSEEHDRAMRRLMGN
jgi:hypothetical protein